MKNKLNTYFMSIIKISDQVLNVRKKKEAFVTLGACFYSHYLGMCKNVFSAFQSDLDFRKLGLTLFLLELCKY